VSTRETTFSPSQFESSYPDGGEKHWWPLARNRIVRSVVLDGAPAGGAILDVGCGRGFVVESLRDAGLDCAGVEAADVEPIAGAAPFVRSRMHAEKLPEVERRRYDTILLLDVIEHLPDTVAFLRGLVDAFPALSRVIVTVPARPELWSNYDEYFGHFRRYSRPMLIDLAKELGWEARRLSYFFHCLYLPAWLMTHVKGRRATRLTPPGPPMRVVHRLIALGMLADHYLLPSRLVGTSLIASFRVRR
jgi:SAM-dependent methyltransferase